MSFFELFLLALALAADAFTVGLAVGVKHRQPRQIFRLSFHFGLFQALLPLAGFAAGIALKRFIDPWGHYFAFGVLAFIGGRMVKGSFQPEKLRETVDLTRGFHLVGLSFVVSIDALAIGFTLGIENVSIVFAVMVIGIIAAVLTSVGMLIAGRIGLLFGKRVELVAGFVLIGLALKILFG